MKILLHKYTTYSRLMRLLSRNKHRYFLIVPNIEVYPETTIS